MSGPRERLYAYRGKVKGEAMTTANLSRLLTWAQYGVMSASGSVCL